VSARGEKIEILLKRKGESPAWLAKQLKVPKQSVYNWIGGAKPQKDSVWAEIARILGVELDVLTDDSQPLPEIGRPQYPIPSLDVLMALWPALPANPDWDLDPAACEDTIEIPAFLARKGPKEPERIAAYIKGRSMEPRLFEGDLVIVELIKTARPGRIVLAKSDKGRTLKVLRSNHNGANRFRLESINADYGDADAEEWSVEGYLIAILRDFAKNRGTIEWDEGGIGP
jgi:hypothetical protein